eukprot:7376538-Prymnesium_polylepis.1
MSKLPIWRMCALIFARAAAANSEAAPSVHLCMAACGSNHEERSQRLSVVLAIIRSIHHSAVRFGFDAVVHLLHDDSEYARSLEFELASYHRSGLTHIRANLTRLPDSTKAEEDGSAVERYPCKFAKLLIPTLLPSVDVVIFLDPLVYVLGNLVDLAQLAISFDQEWAGLSSIIATDGEARYADAAKFNDGVLLANVTRWRSSAFQRFLRSHNVSAPSSAQDVLNAYFQRRTNEVYRIPCEWNRAVHAACSQAPPDALPDLLGGILRDDEMRHPFMTHGLSYVLRQSSLGAPAARGGDVLAAAVGMFLIGRYPTIDHSAYSLHNKQKKGWFGKLITDVRSNGKQTLRGRQSDPSPLVPPARPPPSHTARPPVHICLTVCGLSYAGHAINFIRSVHLSSLVHRFDAVVHVLHDGTAEAVKLREELNAVRQQRLTRMRFNFVQLHSSTFNQLADGNRTSMRASRFVKRHPCVFARLQLLQLLPYLDVVIYVDVDTYVLDDLAELARVAATSFNETQWAGMVLEGEDDSWYSRNLSRGLPFYQPHGLNSGVWV